MTPDRELLDEVIRRLATIERASASRGERQAAEWIAARLVEEGLEARVEGERAHGGYWWPLGLLNAAAIAAAALSAGGARRRRIGRLLAALVLGALVDDLDHRRRLARRLLPFRPTANVLAEAGDPGAARTVLVVAHHDAAHGGAVFDTTLLEALEHRFPDRYARATRWPPLMWLVVLGPLLVALGRRRAGAVVAAGTVAAMADVGRSPVVPGANDNLAAVAALVALARAWREDPPRGVRVLLVSTGSEESNSEGMHALLRRHGAALRRDRTDVVVLECLGSGSLCIAESEGFLWPHAFDAGLKDLAERAARDAGVPVRRGLHNVFTSDGSRALNEGYRTMLLGALDRLNLPSNYHKPTDVPDNVDLDCVARAVRLLDALVRALGAQAPASSARAAATAS